MVDSILLTDWHPLDHRPAPEYVPPRWDGPHVGKRLVEGLRTLRLMPMPRGPREFGSAWPQWMVEWEDRLAREEAERVKEQEVQNRVRLRPSSIEIMHSEISIAWPGHFLIQFPQLLRAVQMCTLARSYERDNRWAAHRLGIPERLVRRWSYDGLDKIAVGLIREKVPVW